MSGTYTTTWNTGILVPSGSSPEPARAPKGLIVTRAVELQEGWVGQVIVAEEIVWQGDPFAQAADAEEDATYHVIVRVKSLFTAPHETDSTEVEGDES